MYIAADQCVSATLSQTLSMKDGERAVVNFIVIYRAREIKKKENKR